MDILKILHFEIMWEAPQSSIIRLYTEKEIIRFDLMEIFLDKGLTT